jgi:hypothetical protein
MVGNHQDRHNGYEARSVVIADSERMADWRPSLTAPNAEYTECLRLVSVRSDCTQIVRICCHVSTARLFADATVGLARRLMPFIR